MTPTEKKSEKRDMRTIEDVENAGETDAHQKSRKRQQNFQVPFFAETASNLTVAEGRTATLPCVVENLGNYRFDSFSSSFHSMRLRAETALLLAACHNGHSDRTLSAAVFPWRPEENLKHIKKTEQTRTIRQIYRD
ncbi:hypothetical protein TNCV_1581421 [Trichonephila clavipes]|nr:hypothetical protein TNCV_1581421 [Trichonephila clavipes]